MNDGQKGKNLFRLDTILCDLIPVGCLGYRMFFFFAIKLSLDAKHIINIILYFNELWHDIL